MSVNAISMKVAWRSILRQRWYSLIHVLGLAIGICVCIVIFLITRYELSFDSFHPDVDRIYRIVGDVQDKDGNVVFLNSPFKDVAGIEHMIDGFELKTSFHFFGTERQEGSFALSTIMTGPDFFRIFPRKWLAGDLTVMARPGHIVLTESAARKYLGDIDVQQMPGKTILYDDSVKLTVGGIVGNWEGPSDLSYTSFIASDSDWKSLQPRASQAFVRLKKGVDPAVVNRRLAEFIRQLRPAPVLFQGSHHLRLYLQSLRDMHYTPDLYPTETGDDFRKAYLPLLYALMWVAVFVLGLAIINFINLSTAQSFQRMKEVGIRKVMGSSRGTLVGQFLIETLLLTGCALVLSIILVFPTLWLFSGIIPAGVNFKLWDGGNWLFLLGIAIVTTLIAGSYPARLMSSYLPVLSLKGSLDKTGKGGVGLRRALIIFQFSFSLLFIIGSLVIGRQVRLMRNADKGFNSEGVITVDYPGAEKGQMRLFAEAVKNLPGVRQAILQGHAPMGREHPTATFVHRLGNGLKMRETTVEAEIGDDNFISFYQMRLVAGHNVDPDENHVPVVINEAYARALGYKDPKDACGKSLYYRGNGLWYAISGVVADYHQVSFHETIRPLILTTWLSEAKSVAVRVGAQGDSTKIVIAGLASIWKMLFPGVQFRASLLQETIDRLYIEENRAALLMQSVTIVMILISCMGLFGLALFSASRRAKEIGIRKVMGATVGSVSLLLSREFVILVVTAIVIASPLAWFFTNTWLANYGYRVAIDAWVFVEAGGAVLLLTVVTVGFQTIRVARVNPINVLRE